MKTGPKRTKEQRELDLAELSRLMRRGVSKREAGRRLSLDEKQVRLDWEELCQRLRDGEKKDVAAMLEEYGEVKAEAWQEWERSKLNKERTTAERTSSGGGEPEARTKAVKVVEGRLADNSYLETIRKVLDQECKLRDLNPVEKHEYEHIHDDVTGLADEDLVARYRAKVRALERGGN